MTEKPEPGTEAWARDIQAPWTERARKHNPAYCCAMVHNGSRTVSFHQCDRKPKVFYGGLGYCGQHDPAAVVKRKEETRARYHAIAEQQARQSAERTRRRKRDEAALDAIRLIAAGHNDPRTLAIAVLAEAGEWPPKEPTP